MRGYSAKVGGWAITGVFLALGPMGSARAGIAPAPAPPPPAPADGTTGGFFVADEYTYDDNLYRIPADFGSVASLLSPNATRGDRVNMASVGGYGQWIAGRQDVDLTVRIDNSHFANNTSLNNTGGDALLTWNWQVGSYFSGDVGAEYNRALAGFGETRYLGRDMVDGTSYFGDAKWQIGPRWALVGGLRDSDYTHGAEAAAFNNFRNKTGKVGVQYATGVADVFGLEYQYTDGTYPPNYTFDNVLFDRNFKENSYRGTAQYAINDKLNVDAYAGYLTHTLPSDNILPSKVFGNFSGDIWRVTVNWLATEKTQLQVAGWRELHAYMVNASNYFVSKGVSISPVWTPREKITVALEASLEDQSYSNLNTYLASLTAPRYDKVTGEQINIYYRPRDQWSVNLFVRHENRDSNESTFSYGDKLASVSVTYKFW